MRSREWAILMLCLLAVGCGPGKHPTAPVSGIVTWKDKPLTRGRVIFMHHTGPSAYGDIGPDGRYKLEAPVGECWVAVSCREPLPDWPPDKMPTGPHVPKSLIPETYEDHMRSGLKFDVQASPNTADWKLK